MSNDSDGDCGDVDLLWALVAISQATLRWPCCFIKKHPEIGCGDSVLPEFQVLRRVGLPGPQQQEREDLVLGTREVTRVFNQKSYSRACETCSSQTEGRNNMTNMTIKRILYI